MVSQLEPGKLYRYDGNGQQFVFMCLMCLHITPIAPPAMLATILTGFGGTGAWQMAKRCDLFVDIVFRDYELANNITEIRARVPGPLAVRSGQVNGSDAPNHVRQITTPRIDACE